LCYESIMDVKHFKSVTLQQLEAVVVLVEEGSFSRAAKKMLLTQPALTKSIKNVENYLGTKVVNRGNAGISLTPEGKIIYDYARRVIKLRHDTGEKIFKLHKNTGGNIYLSASTIPATYILPRTLSAFRQDHPDITVYLRMADSQDSLNMVLDNETDLGCIGKKPLHKKLIAEPLWKDRLILAVPASHRWHEEKFIALPELLAEPFILREKGSATRDLMESYLKEVKSVNISQFNICCELGSSEAVKEAILDGLGVSIISIHAVTRELSQRLLYEVPLQGCRMERNFYLIYRRQTKFQPAQQTFIDFLKKDAAL